MHYRFDWDFRKEHANADKHGVTFRQATTVFRDPNQLSIYDEIHSEDENRWITIGLDSKGIPLIVVHTFEQIDASIVNIRIISARRAVKAEVRQYRKGKP